MPEEGRADRGGGVVEDGFEEVAGVFVHYVVDIDCFVLYFVSMVYLCTGGWWEEEVGGIPSWLDRIVHLEDLGLGRS